MGVMQRVARVILRQLRLATSTIGLFIHFLFIDLLAQIKINTIISTNPRPNNNFILLIVFNLYCYQMLVNKDYRTEIVQIGKKGSTRVQEPTEVHMHVQKNA